MISWLSSQGVRTERVREKRGGSKGEGDVVTTHYLQGAEEVSGSSCETLMMNELKTGWAVIINSRAVASLSVTIVRDPPRVRVGTGKSICECGIRNEGDARLGSGSLEGEGCLVGHTPGVMVLR